MAGTKITTMKKPEFKDREYYKEPGDRTNSGFIYFILAIVIIIGVPVILVYMSNHN
jgi:hypothetical protein